MLPGGKGLHAWPNADTHTPRRQGCCSQRPPAAATSIALPNGNACARAPRGEISMRALSVAANRGEAKGVRWWTLCRAPCSLHAVSGWRIRSTPPWLMHSTRAACEWASRDVPLWRLAATEVAKHPIHLPRAAAGAWSLSHRPTMQAAHGPGGVQIRRHTNAGRREFPAHKNEPNYNARLPAPGSPPAHSRPALKACTNTLNEYT